MAGKNALICRSLDPFDGLGYTEGNPLGDDVKGNAISKKTDQRLDIILETAAVIAASEREKTDVKTSIGKLANVDVPFLISYITQLEAVIQALKEEKHVMALFDQAIAGKDEQAIALNSQQVMKASQHVEKALQDLDRFESLFESDEG